MWFNLSGLYVCILVLLSTTTIQNVETNSIGSSCNILDECKETKKKCNFENGYCYWIQAKSPEDSMDWMITDGATDSTSTGPQFDHTLGTPAGHYAYIEASAKKRGSRARLISSVMQPNETGLCIEFYYHMYGRDIDQLNVYWKTNGGEEALVWSRKGARGPQWYYGQAHIDRQHPLQMVIEATRGIAWAADIAIDDVKFDYGFCPPTLDCGFENGYDLCGYTNDDTSHFNWKLGGEITGEYESTIGYDHTYGTESGNYMFVPEGRQAGQRARLQSKQYNLGVDHCLTFYSYIHGSDIGTVSVFVLEQGAYPNVLWSVNTSQSNHWLPVQVTISAFAAFQVVFEADVGSDYHIAIDDVFLHPGECPPLGSCDFEKGLCTWQNSVDEDFDWFRSSGQTMSGNTGPSTDHTFGTPYGVYLLLESSIPQEEGDMTRLFSVRFDGSTSRCIQFFYNIHSKNPTKTGKLEVIQYWSSGINYKLWEENDVYGDKWIETMIDLPNNVTNNEAYVIRIQGYVGSTPYGDIAIDDIMVMDGVCKYKPTPPPDCGFYCDYNNIPTSQCIPQSSVCDFNIDCVDSGIDELDCGYDCSFDDTTSACGWQDQSFGVFRWSGGSGQSSESNTGPSSDHTTGNGRYMYVDADEGLSGSKAHFVSKMIPSSGPACEVNFYFHMYGDHIGILQVNKLIEGHENVMFSLVGNQGDGWLQAIVRIGRNERPFQVDITAIRSYDVLGDIAIDDITFTNCEMPPVKLN